MTTIKKHDFVQIEYTGKLNETDAIFDTTNEEIAKKEEIYNPSMPYGKYIICIGENQILHGLEEEMIGKNVGEDYDIELTAENAFGKKDAKLLKLIPTSVFKKQGIQAQSGLQVNIDGQMGTIRTVTGGRTVVDFNHPLSGKDVSYKVKVSKIIEDDKEKVAAIVKMALNTKDIDVELKEGKADIRLKDELPQEITTMIGVKIKELVKTVNHVDIKKRA